MRAPEDQPVSSSSSVSSEPKKIAPEDQPVSSSSSYVESSGEESSSESRSKRPHLASSSDSQIAFPTGINPVPLPAPQTNITLVTTEDLCLPNKDKTRRKQCRRDPPTLSPWRPRNAAPPNSDGHGQELPDRLPAPLDSVQWPPGTFTEIDNATLSSGLYANYRTTSAGDPFASYPGTVATIPDEGFIVNEQFFAQWSLEQVRKYEKMRNASVILLFTDTRLLEDIPHWKHVIRLMLNRTLRKGEFDEQVFLLFLKIPPETAHMVWAGVYALRSLALLLPEVNLFMWDHDATVTCLYETPHLTALARNSQLPYLYKPLHYGVIIISEANAQVNAGIVGFPRLPLINAPWLSEEERAAVSDAYNLAASFLKNLQAPDDPKHVAKLLQHQQLQETALAARKQDLPTDTVPKHGYECNVEDPEEEASFLYDRILPDLSDVDSDSEAYAKQVSGVEWQDEHEMMLLNNTPLHRSKALTRNDLLHAWALIGKVLHKIGFSKEKLKSQTAQVGHLGNLQFRRPSVGQWASAFFEQTVLRVLVPLASRSAAVAHLPGLTLFMDPYVPGSADKTMPACITHAYGPHAKSLIQRLDNVQHWFDIGEVLSPFKLQNGVELFPYFAQQNGFQPANGFTAKLCTSPSFCNLFQW